MSRYTPSNLHPGSGDGRALVVCDRTDLSRWSDEGGPLPPGLANHIAHCEACSEQVRRINRVHASLALLGNQPLPANLHARANGRALRMLRKATRASEAAGRLLRMRPDLPFWQRAQVHIARASMASAAAFLVCMMRIGLLAGIEHTETMGQTLASAHWDRHIDPDREWIDRQA